MNDSVILAAIAGVFGLTFGSFLNVCSIRWPEDRSVVAPRSSCPGCGSMIAWYDNLPVLSWLILRGRCRHCGQGVSIQYPLVELATGLIWAGVVAYYGVSWEAFRGGLFLTILFGISLSDARYYIIPDEFSVGGAVIGVALSFFPEGVTWKASLLGAALGYASLWAVGVGGTWMIRKMNPERLVEAGVDSALGGGDIKMMMMVGAFLGPWGVAMTVFFGSVFALVIYGPISYLTRKLIPLGIFLAAGGALTYAWGDAVLNWYTTSILGL